MENMKMSVKAAASARDIEIITEEIQFYKINAGECIFQIGKRLLEAKAQMSHGDWLPWLNNKVGFSEKSAQNLMRIAKEYTNPQLVSDLGKSKSLLLLALESEEREEFVSTPHVVASGEEKMAKDMTVKELEKALQELEETKTIAKRAEEQMTLRLEELEREHEDALAAVKTEQEIQKEEYEARLREKADQAAEQAARQEERVAQLEKELEAARQEAAEPDENVLAQLRSRVAAEEAEKLERKLEKAKGDAKKAKEGQAQAEKKLKEAEEQARKEAEEARKQAEEKLRAAEEAARQQAEARKKEREELEKKLERAEKQLAVSADEDMLAFKIHFKAAQAEINTLIEHLDKMETDGKTALWEKMSRAMVAFLEGTLSLVMEEEGVQDGKEESGGGEEG